MLFGKKQSLVGLDIGSHTIKAVELEGDSGKTYKLIRWGISAPLAEAIVDGEIMDLRLVTDAISNLLESRSIKSRNVVAAVSGRAVIVKKITMNRLSAEDAQQAVYWEAAQNALQANYDFGPDEVVAILNVGAEITNINIIQAGVPYFTKDLQVGGNSFIEAAQRKFNLSQSEAAAAVRGESGGNLEMASVIDQVSESIATALERAQ